ncbi:unnamed protein product [Hymenolepis diminuta]|uniref:Uncharacterized protein n=1 Tax=Hymenolepis diminuta TaxID=6216 RepID=A0A564Z9Y9_HYMDI|nr:unnamed protein product [Hymenolepis diminuta]
MRRVEELQALLVDFQPRVYLAETAPYTRVLRLDLNHEALKSVLGVLVSVIPHLRLMLQL